MRIALDEGWPWSMRLIGCSIGAATLLVLIKAPGRSLVIPSRRATAGTSSSGHCSSSVAFGIARTYAATSNASG